MTDRLTDAEVDNYFIDLARLPVAPDPPLAWLRAWVDVVRGWPFVQLSIGFTTFVFFVVLVVLVAVGSAAADRLWVTCAYVLGMCVLVPIAIYERH